MVDRLDPSVLVDRQLVSLLAGERATFRIASAGAELALPTIDVTAATPPLWCTANDLVTPR
jgi:hypothetical protein